MVCLPDTGFLSGSLFAAPLLLVRGLGRRAAHWLVINHQRHLQKLSVRRRHRQSLGQKTRPCSEPLVSRTCHEHDCKVRPRSEPVTTCTHDAHSPASGRSPVPAGVEDVPCGHEVDVHISGIHVPVKPLVVICSHPGDACGPPAATAAGWSRSCFLRVPPVSHRCSSGRCQDYAPLLSCSSSDGRETVNRQSQGSRAQQQPAPYNIGHNQLHGISVVNAKSHPVTSQGPPIITPKRPPAPLPGFQNQPPSSNVTHSRQHESSSDGLGFTQSRSTLSSGQGSPNLSSNRSPMPIPAFNISGSSAGSSLTAGHSSNQKTEHYPGPQHQPKSGDYLQFDEVPKEMAPSVPGAPSLPHIGETNPVQIKLHGGESIELLPLYRRIMDQPYFHMISRAKSKDILKTAMDGMFLIRPSTRSNDPLTLCLRHGGRTYNINIRHRRDGLFALGSEKSNEMIFSSVEEMIALHRREPIRLQNGKRAMLTESPPKFGHDYVEILNVSRN